MQGRTEVVDQLNRAIVSLERETYDAQKRVETFLQTKEAFERHLEGIEEFNPEDWSRTEMRDELTRALGVIEDAKAEYQKSMARVQSAIECSEMSAPAIAADPEMLPESPFPVSEVLPTDEPATLPVTKDFGYWFRAGFAFTLPLIIFGIFALAVYILLV